MPTERHYVYFEDEAPSIGAGWRPVEAFIGRKWVRLRPVNSEMRRSKIKREVWNKLRKDERYLTRI